MRRLPDPVARFAVESEAALFPFDAADLLKRGADGGRVVALLGQVKRDELDVDVVGPLRGPLVPERKRPHMVAKLEVGLRQTEDQALAVGLGELIRILAQLVEKAEVARRPAKAQRTCPHKPQFDAIAQGLSGGFEHWTQRLVGTAALEEGREG